MRERRMGRVFLSLLLAVVLGIVPVADLQAEEIMPTEPSMEETLSEEDITDWDENHIQGGGANPETLQDESESSDVNVEEEKTDSQEPEEAKSSPEEALSESSEILPEGTDSLDLAVYEVDEDTEPGQAEVEVDTFEELKEAIAHATEPTTIVITDSFQITETIRIPSDVEITLVARPKEAAPENPTPKQVVNTGAIDDGDWTVTNPHEIALSEEEIASYEKEGVLQEKLSEVREAQKALIEEAREKASVATDLLDLTKNPLDPGNVITLERSNLLDGPMFYIRGRLCLGTNETDPDTGKSLQNGIFFDGVKHLGRSSGFAEVSFGGSLTLNHGVIANFENPDENEGVIRVRDSGEMIQNGGRITNNESVDYTGGALTIHQGASFTMNGGSIDHNAGMAGGIYAGTVYTDGNDLAEITINKGLIANNTGRWGKYTPALGGGLALMALTDTTINNGLLINNISEFGAGGAIHINDSEIENFDGISFVDTYDPLDVMNSHHSAALTMNGGLLAGNQATGATNSSGAGGAIYAGTNGSKLNLNQGLILDNQSANMGGGIYYSIVPYDFSLSHTMVTQNKANSGKYLAYAPGYGGGMWNCPAGVTTIEDGHSLYVFDNEAQSGGDDIAFLGKSNHYLLNGQPVADDFLITLSPVTEEGNVIHFEDDKGNLPATLRDGRKSVLVSAKYTSELLNEAWQNTRLFIIGNSSLKGGGVGSNASFHTEPKKGDYEISVAKHWDAKVAAEDIPEEIRIDLLIGAKGQDIEALGNYAESTSKDSYLAKYGELILSDENDWSGTFAELPFTPEELDQRGLQYYIREDNQDFAVHVEETRPTEENPKHTFDVTNAPMTDIYVIKQWDDQIAADHIPESVTVRILANGEETGKTFTLNEENGWSGLLKNLPLYENGEKIEYTVEEDPIDGFTARVIAEPGEEEQAFVIYNMYSTETTSIPVTKIWQDGENQDGIRPESITVRLLVNGEASEETLTLNEANGWSDAFTDLPVYEAGEKIVYSVEEVTVDGYTTQITGDAAQGFVITNSYNPETVTVEGTKTWNDANDQDGLRPESITIRLLANGEEKDVREVSESEGWSWKFENLPRYEKGEEITYTISEDAVEGYTTKVDGYDVTNTHEPEEPTPPTPEEPENPKPHEPENPTPPTPEEPKNPKPHEPEKPSPKKSEESPKTGDVSTLMTYGVMLGSAAAGLFVIRRKRK